MSPQLHLLVSLATKATASGVTMTVLACKRWDLGLPGCRMVALYKKAIVSTQFVL